MPQLQPNDEIRVFIPITKIDVEKRIVYGTLAAEVPDKSGEIMDYESAKGAIKEWSDAQSEASGGKSLGNVREMHGNVAAGKLTDLVFIDDEKKVEGAAKVVDDSTWQKVQEGVLTGFSIGGGYAKRWIDPENPQLKRYTPKVSEFSMVDNPCQPGATFEVVKADGSVELRKFQSSPNSAQEAQSNMTTTATTENAAANLEVKEPQKRWQAQDGSLHKSKKDALAKNAEILVKTVTEPANKALAKLDGEGDGAGAGVDVTHNPPAEGAAPAADAAEGATHTSSEGNEGATPQAGDAPDPAKEGGGEPAAAPAADPAPAAAAEGAGDAGAMEKAAKADKLKKGLYEVSRADDLLQSLIWFQTCVQEEAIREMDGSPLPADLKAIAMQLAEFLKKLVIEETAELFPVEEVEVLELAAKGAPVGELAKFITADKEGLAKKAGASEFVARLEKAASKTDKAHLGAMSDHLGTMQKCVDGMMKCMKGLGMADDDADEDDMEKLAKAGGLTDEQLTKLAAFDGLAKSFDELTGKLGEMAERLEKVERTPAATKGIVNTALVKKDGSGEGTPTADATLQKMIANGASPEQTVQELMKHTLRNPAAVVNP